MRQLPLVIALLATSSAALAYRDIWVNGQRMGPAEIAYLEQLRCGPIPDGRYWLNTSSEIWGYAGNPRPQGHISDNCSRGQSGGGREMIRRGPFGDYMSDGQCSFVNGVPVGRC